MAIFSFGVISVLPLGNDAVMVAQEKKEGEKAAAPEPAAEKADDGTAKASADNPTSVFTWLFGALGALYITVFLLLSFTFVALFVMKCHHSPP